LPFSLRERTFWLAVAKGLGILLLVDTILTIIFVALGYWPPTTPFIGLTFLEAAALMIVGASLALYREHYLREGLQMIFLGFLLFLVSSLIDWVGFWFGI